MTTLARRDPGGADGSKRGRGLEGPGEPRRGGSLLSPGLPHLEEWRCRLLDRQSLSSLQPCSRLWVSISPAVIGHLHVALAAPSLPWRQVPNPGNTDGLWTTVVSVGESRYGSHMCSTASGILAALTSLPTDAHVDSEELTALRQVAERAQAVYLARLARFEASDGFRADGYGSAWTWLRDQARALPAEARSEVWLARRLHTDVIRAMPATERALAAGELTVGQARTIAGALSRLPAGRATAMEPTVVQEAVFLGPAATPRLCAHLVDIGEDEDAIERAERERAARHVHLRPVGGMLHLDGLLPPVQAAPLITALEAFGQPAPAGPDGEPDERSTGQRRADALCEIAHQVLDHGAPVLGGLRPHVQVVINIDDLVDCTGHGSEQHLGSVRTPDIRETACDAEVSWVAVTPYASPADPPPSHDSPSEPAPSDAATPGFAPPAATTQPPTEPPPTTHPAASQASASPRATGPDPEPPPCERRPPRARPEGAPPGETQPRNEEAVDLDLINLIRAKLPPALGGSARKILAAGRTVRLVPPHIRRALNVRDQGCVSPGCNRPPDRCHAHHVHHWVDGGPTDLSNLVLACAHHHHHWHRHDLKPEQQPGGAWRIVPDAFARAKRERGRTRTESTSARTMSWVRSG